MTSIYPFHAQLVACKILVAMVMSVIQNGIQFSSTMYQVYNDFTLINSESLMMQV